MGMHYKVLQDCNVLVHGQSVAESTLVETAISGYTTSKDPFQDVNNPTSVMSTEC
jgi:hypothetical protein